MYRHIHTFELPPPSPPAVNWDTQEMDIGNMLFAQHEPLDEHWVY